MIAINDIKLYSYYSQKFPYHLVDSSPWPLLVSYSMLSLTVGAVMSMQLIRRGVSLFLSGLNLTTSGMFLWFKDVTIEGTYQGWHTKEVKNGLIIGVALFIVSEAFAFLSVFWAFFHSSLSPAIEMGGMWPPIGINAIDPFAVPLLNTVLLLSSGAWVTYGHHALIAEIRVFAIIGTTITVVLAVVFTLLQWYEYLDAGFSIADGIYGTSFYAATGLHGFHVIIGTIFILVGLVRLVGYHLTSQHHLGFESAILYWHFVDVVWLFLFVSVYFWGGA